MVWNFPRDTRGLNIRTSNIWYIHQWYFLFVEKSEICNFAGDNTVYSCGKDLPKITENLRCTMKSILKWFRLNSLKANPGNFQFMILGDKTCYKHTLTLQAPISQNDQTHSSNS